LRSATLRGPPYRAVNIAMGGGKCKGVERHLGRRLRGGRGAP